MYGPDSNRAWELESNLITGIPSFNLLMWGHTKKGRKRKPRKQRSISSTKGKVDRLEL